LILDIAVPTAAASRLSFPNCASQRVHILLTPLISSARDVVQRPRVFDPNGQPMLPTMYQSNLKVNESRTCAAQGVSEPKADGRREAGESRFMLHISSFI